MLLQKSKSLLKKKRNCLVQSAAERSGIIKHAFRGVQGSIAKIHTSGDHNWGDRFHTQKA